MNNAILRFINYAISGGASVTIAINSSQISIGEWVFHIGHYESIERAFDEALTHYMEFLVTKRLKEKMKEALEGPKKQ